MSQRPNMHSWLIPVNLLQLEEFPLKWRVLLAMSKFMNRKCECWASAAKLCLLIGEVDENGSPSASGLKAVRAARQALTKGGIITHYTVVEDAEPQHRWRLNFSPFKPGLAGYLDKEGVPLDRWADAEAEASEAEASEPKVDKPKVDKPKVDKPKVDKPKVDKPKEVVEEVVEVTYEEGDLYEGDDGELYCLGEDREWYGMEGRDLVLKKSHVRLITKK